MKTIAKIALTLALLPAAAFAAESEDPVLASFERDLAREPIAYAQRPVFVEEDPLRESFHVAVYGARQPEIHATSIVDGVLRNDS